MHYSWLYINNDKHRFVSLDVHWYYFSDWRYVTHVCFTLKEIIVHSKISYSLCCPIICDISVKNAAQSLHFFSNGLLWMMWVNLFRKNVDHDELIAIWFNGCYNYCNQVIALKSQLFRHSGISWLASVSYHRIVNCLFSSLLRLTIKKHQSSELQAICKVNLPMVIGGFPPQMASSAERVSMSWSPYFFSNLFP